MKKIVLILCAMMMVALLSGCGAPAVKEHSEIIGDISQTKDFTESFPQYIVNDIDIVKRQTDVQNKSDKVYVTLSVTHKDKDVGGDIDMIVSYGLYNDGWILDKCEIDTNGENGGTRFYPTKELELSSEDISSLLNVHTGETYKDIEIYFSETDLEAGIATYSVTGTSVHTYMTEKIDATFSFAFAFYGGFWEPPTFQKNSSEEEWYIGAIFDDPNFDDQDIVAYVDESMESLSVTYEGSFGESESNIQIYTVSDTPLQTVMGHFFDAVNYYDSEYLTYYDFSVKMQGAFTSYNAFDYVAWWNGGGRQFDGMLFIGRDELGYLWGDDYEIDKYNHKVVVDVFELTPRN